MSVTVAVARASGDASLTVQSGATLVFGAGFTTRTVFELEQALGVAEIVQVSTRLISSQVVELELDLADAPADRALADAESAAEELSRMGRTPLIVAAGGRIRLVQVYTVARPPAERNVAALRNEQIDAIAARGRRRTGLPAEGFYGRPT